VRTGIALAAAGWFIVAAIVSSFTVAGGELTVVLEAIRAASQTLFVGLAILSLTMVDWREVRDFFLVDRPAATTAPDGQPSDD
jgi:hypothetical protein